MTDWSSSSTEAAALPAGAVARGALRPPGSKSLTHRAYALALLARAPVDVERPLDAEDTRLFLAVLEQLGHRVERGELVVRIAPASPPPASATFDCGNAGTLFRFLTAVLATVPGEWMLDGSARLRERPIVPLVAALGELGVRIDFLGAPGHAPLRVHGGTLAGGRARLDAGESSQYLSALLLAGQRAVGPIEIDVARLTSAPYVELTVDAIADFGGVVEQAEPGLWVARPSELRGGAVEIEPDLSAAAYPAAAAALTGGDVTLEGVSLASRQGDRRLLELLATMGARVEQEPNGVRVRGAGLMGLDDDLSDIPDQVPTLAALAPFARGTTRIRNVAHLRVKESDRLAAMARELRRAGAEVEELADGLVVPGVWAERQPPATPVEIDPHGDHRIAMAMALVGLRRQGLSVREPRVVGKSWPRFWAAMTELLAPVSAATEGR